MVTKMVDAEPPVGSIVGHDELAELYRPPSRIVAEKKVATLDETIRINGPAWVTVSASTLDFWNGELRRPTTAIVVRADEVFMQCAKAFRRGRRWDPASWETLPDTPDRFDAATREWLENSYVAGLAADQPER